MWVSQLFLLIHIWKGYWTKSLIDVLFKACWQGIPTVESGSTHTHLQSHAWTPCPTPLLTQDYQDPAPRAAWFLEAQRGSNESIPSLHHQKQTNKTIPIKWDHGRQCPLTWLKPFDPIEQTICILFTQPVHPPTQTHTDAHAHTQTCSDIGGDHPFLHVPAHYMTETETREKTWLHLLEPIPKPFVQWQRREFCLGFSM